jgi:hypothetical protein
MKHEMQRRKCQVATRKAKKERKKPMRKKKKEGKSGEKKFKNLLEQEREGR